ncbi:MAG TPA: sigma-70 family RNA polymerase sigma factor [Polyangiaceae bacterium]|nr:sigma-70 family RNA polymerase sigma factor [Polyangiaceae bacterium]
MAGSSKIVSLVDAKKGKAPRPHLPVDPAPDPGALLLALRAGEPWAERAFLEGETGNVERVLTRILGFGCELDDLTQEVFVRAFARLDDLREPDALRGWLSSIAVFVARETIRKKRRRRWLVFLPAQETPEIVATPVSPEARDALRAFYDVVSGLDADTRIAFTLRCVGGMELTEIAEVCEVSLATIKRRIKRAASDFYARGRARPELVDWFEEGTRWRQIKS